MTVAPGAADLYADLFSGEGSSGGTLLKTQVAEVRPYTCMVFRGMTRRRVACPAGSSCSVLVGRGLIIWNPSANVGSAFFA